MRCLHRADGGWRWRSVLDLVNTVWQRQPMRHSVPIKGYVQVVRIVIYALAVILMIATLIDRCAVDPAVRSGRDGGGASADLPGHAAVPGGECAAELGRTWGCGGVTGSRCLDGVDGGVVDIALHTVKVQNSGQDDHQHPDQSG